MKEANQINPITADDIINLVLDENQIEEHRIPHAELFYLRFADRTLGPVWASNLKDFLKLHLDQIENNVQIRSFTGTTWGLLFEHPLFNRRRLMVLDHEESDLVSEKFHIIVHGNLEGPFSLSTIKNRINKNELFLTDNLSIDGGKTWKKIYKYKVFDRRSDASNLPSPPKSLHQETLLENNIIKDIEPMEEITGLYKLKATKIKEDFKNNLIDRSKKMLNNRPIIILISLVIGFLALIVFFDIFNSSNDLNNSSEKGLSIHKNKSKTKNRSTSLKTTEDLAANKIQEATPSENIKPEPSSPQNSYSRTKAALRRERELGRYKNTWVKDAASNNNYVDESDNGPEHSELNNGVSDSERDYGEIIQSDDNTLNTREGYLEKLDQASEESDTLQTTSADPHE